jgi:hypothetical protein
MQDEDDELVEKLLEVLKQKNQPQNLTALNFRPVSPGLRITCSLLRAKKNLESEGEKLPDSHVLWLAGAGIHSAT